MTLLLLYVAQISCYAVVQPQWCHWC